MSLASSEALQEDSLEEERQLYRRFGGGRLPGGCIRRFRPRTTILETLAIHPNLDHIFEIVRGTGFEDLLSGDESLTLFAPRDIAFDQASRDLVNRLYQTEYRFHARDLVMQHILEGTICEFDNGETYVSLNGAINNFIQDGAVRYVSTVPDVDSVRPVPVVDFNTHALNGVIHMVEELLLPVWVTRELFDMFSGPSYSVIRELVVAASMESVFSDESRRLTIFAPTNKAFNEIDDAHLECMRKDTSVAESILRSHTTEGLWNIDKLQTMNLETLDDGVSISIVKTDSITLNGKGGVIDPNNLAYSGVLNGIDSVLLPDGFDCGFFQTAMEESGTVLGLLREEGMVTLAGLIESAGLVDLFTNPDVEITIFAPTEAAFTEISMETLFCLSQDKEALKSLLRYHTLDSIYYEEDLAIVELLETTDRQLPVLVNGVTASDKRTQINDAGVTDGDIFASNGVIHKISRVVHPPGAQCM